MCRPTRSTFSAACLLVLAALAGVPASARAQWTETEINDSKAHGNAFFGILGGEPFMHPQLLELFAAHPDCYFQVFTW